jgi:hypothetical protein
VVNITYQLKGADARLFLTYKKQEHLKNDAEAARQLMLKQLHSTMKKPTTGPRSKRKRADMSY